MAKANVLTPTEGGKVSKARGGSRKGSKRRKLSQRFAAFKGSDLGKLAIFSGEIAGASALASAAKGYFGDKINLWGVDGRLIAGAAALGVGQFGIPGVGKVRMGQDLVHVGLGILTSWINDQAFEFGGKMKPAAVSEAPPAMASEPQGAGLVHVGTVDEVGISEKRKARLERRLERKFGRLKRKADKHDIDWKDVRTPGEEPEHRPRVLPPPAYYAPQRYAARHPVRAAAFARRHPGWARRAGIR